MALDELGRVDRSTLQVTHLDAPDDTVAYWRCKTPQERLAALEAIRQVCYGYDPAAAGLQRVLTVAKLARR